MTYLITALDAEARPFIEHYRLKRESTLPYAIYRNEEILVLVTQPGRLNAMMATSALLGWKVPQANDILINVGICGGPEHLPIGEALLIHQIHDGARRYYPDILYPHTLRESPLLCLDEPADTVREFPVDMESGGVFAAASRFFRLHRIAFLKIVSDHCNPAGVTKENVQTLLRSHFTTLEELIALMRQSLHEEPLFNDAEQARIAEWKAMCTAAQGIRLGDALSYFRLRHPKEAIVFPASPFPDSKRERSALLESFIATLTA